jgi:triosephosphate isomerase
MSFNNSINFCTKNFNALKQLSQNADIVLCPSYVALTSVINLIKGSTVSVGAQNCCEYESGAYTGEISVSSLKEINITYCIIGHSERRIYHNETTETIIKKMELLFTHNIQPIICIGETKQDFICKKTYAILVKQIEPLISIIQQYNKDVIITYEPVWSIGTGIIPEPTILQENFAWLRQLLSSKLPNNTIKLLYGGSVNSNNISQLKNIKYIDGFLIGGASTQYEEFEKIILNK